ncbi:HAD family hydrolase [Dysosmobacter welbionis]|uniref:HAD family hydrolase n=1 Tax=Dysosmobacter welbionis TaxID=2093857 RepID=UPI002357FBAF|nr:HAD family hydrolase [Dysosmobacter welbionis]
MGGTLEDIWYNEDTQRATCRRLLEVLRANGLEPGCPDDVFWKRITDGVKAYKQWSEGICWRKSRRRFGRTGIFGTLPLTGKAAAHHEELASLWEVTLPPGAPPRRRGRMLQALKSRGYHLGVISNNASLYNVFRVLEDYGIRGFMEDVTVSSVTRLSQTPSEIFRIALRQMQASRKCASMWATRSPGTSSAPGRWALPRPCRSLSFLSEQKDVHVAADAVPARQGYRNH